MPADDAAGRPPVGIVLADQRVDALVRAVGLALVDQQAGVVDVFRLGIGVVGVAVLDAVGADAIAVVVSRTEDAVAAGVARIGDVRAPHLDRGDVIEVAKNIVRAIAS